MRQPFARNLKASLVYAKLCFMQASKLLLCKNTKKY